MATPTLKYKYTLYTFFGSSCSALHYKQRVTPRLVEPPVRPPHHFPHLTKTGARVRIACHLKSIPLEYKFIDLLTAGQNAPSYAALNPSEFVPLLVVHNASTGAEIAKISQSVAIMEFLEEVETDCPVKLLPSDPLRRAKVKELIGVITADTQPVTNQRIVKYIVPRGLDEQEWQGHFMRKGLAAYEKLASLSAGRWSVGDEISLADIALVPAVDRGARYKIDVGKEFPTIARIDAAMRETEAYQKGGYRSQPDTPESMRAPRL